MPNQRIICWCILFLVAPPVLMLGLVATAKPPPTPIRLQALTEITEDGTILTGPLILKRPDGALEAQQFSNPPIEQKDRTPYLLWVHGEPGRPVRNVVIRNLTLDGNIWKAHRGGDPERTLYITNAEDVLIENVTVTNGWVNVKVGENTKNIRFRNVHSTHYDEDGFNVSNGAQDIVVENCLINEALHATNGGDIELDPGHRSSKGTRDAGFEIENGVDGLIIKRCTIDVDGSDFLIKRDDSIPPNIKNRRIIFEDTVGTIDILNASADPEDITVRNHTGAIQWW